MRSLRAKPLESNSLTWLALRGYLVAVGQIFLSRRPRLDPSSFTRVAARSTAGLPPSRTVCINGGDIAYRHYASPGANRSLVLLHGSGCFGDQFSHLASSIAEGGSSEVFTLDLRGHGMSPGPRGHAISAPGQLIADVGTFIEKLRKNRPGTMVFLGGHSAGGGLALGVARSPAKSLIDGFIFLAPYLGVGSPVDRPSFGGWVHVYTCRLAAIVLANLLGFRRFNHVSVLAFEQEARDTDDQYCDEWSFDTMLAFGPGTWSVSAPPISRDTPVLVIAGDQDECFLSSRYHECFAQVAPHAEVRTTGGGHWDLLVDRKAASLVSGWLKHRFPKALSRTHADGPRALSNQMHRLVTRAG